ASSSPGALRPATVAAVLGAALLIYGLTGRGRSHPRLGRAWMGLFVVIETVPRLAGWSSGVVLALSVLALVPLALASRLLLRADESRSGR
ncbi:MAG: hypothetical protein JO144_01960, partial [Actinobacteria bacterium]|nr:hypothetical protein [Actinomycetota bacterium]